MRILRVVLGEQVRAEIAREVAPHGVVVVRLVLHVVVLDQERGPVDAVVMALALLEAAGPMEREELLLTLMGMGIEPLSADEYYSPPMIN